MKVYKTIIISITVILMLTGGFIIYSLNRQIPIVPPPAKPLLWGAFAGNDTGGGDLATFEQLVGKPVNMQAYFVGWGDSFPTSTAASLKPSGKTLVLFWEETGTTLDNIISGESDTYISQFVADTKAYGGPVIFVPLPEMNGNWDSWGGAAGTNTPAKVISAWKHIHDTFTGVANVKFAWDVNNISTPDTASNSIAMYYPGDAYVDYIGVDGFNFGNPWQTWSDVFAPALAQVSVYNKPIYILSMGSVPGPQKAQWITDGLGTEIKKYPRVVGWVWFNQNGADGDWIINSDPTSLAAFKQILP